MGLLATCCIELDVVLVFAGGVKNVLDEVGIVEHAVVGGGSMEHERAPARERLSESPRNVYVIPPQSTATYNRLQSRSTYEHARIPRGTALIESARISAYASSTILHAYSFPTLAQPFLHSFYITNRFPPFNNASLPITSPSNHPTSSPIFQPPNLFNMSQKAIGIDLGALLHCRATLFSG